LRPVTTGRVVSPTHMDKKKVHCHVGGKHI
jgi:hypothetical protein